MGRHGHDGPSPVIEKDKVGHVDGDLLLSHRIQTVSPSKDTLLHRKIGRPDIAVHL